MPYDKVSDLPDAVKKLPTEELRAAWLKAFNSAYAQYKDDGKAAGTAWAVIHKMGYKQNKGGEWVKAEANYIKDIMYAGTFPHPQNPDESVTITEKDLQEMAAETERFLQSGGKSPVTVSHPENQEQKITLTKGWTEDVFYDPDTARLVAAVKLDEEAKGWVEDGKVQTVSPGIVYGVVTANGKFKSLVDHIALTNSPHLLDQSDFIPMAAEKYQSAQIFYGENCIEYSAEIGLARQITEAVVKRLPKWMRRPDAAASTNGGEEMDELKKQLETLQSQFDAKVKDFDTLKAERDTLAKKVEEHETAAKTAAEAEQKAKDGAFEAELNGLVKSLKVKPADAARLKAEYACLPASGVNFENATVTRHDFLLSPYRDVPPVGKGKIDPGKMYLENGTVIDAASVEGRAFLNDEAMKLAAVKYEEARKTNNDPLLRKESFYEVAYQEVFAKHAKHE